MAVNEIKRGIMRIYEIITFNKIVNKKTNSCFTPLVFFICVMKDRDNMMIHRMVYMIPCMWN